jgi:MFS family permease
MLGFMTVGGMLFQFPLGKLSDMVDRRLVIVGAPGLSIPLCLVLASLENPAADLNLLYALVVLLGGLTLPIYSVCMAHMNDHLKPSQVVAASGTLILILAAGMTIGPFLGGMAIEHYGPEGIFYLLSLTAILTVMTTLFRWMYRPARVESRSTAVAVSASLTPEAANLYSDASAHDDSRGKN